MNQILKRQASRFLYGSKVPAVTITVFILMEELRMEDQQSFFNFLRMPLEIIDEILSSVGPRIRIVDTPQESIGTGPQASYHYSTFSVR